MANINFVPFSTNAFDAIYKLILEPNLTQLFKMMPVSNGSNETTD
jgi:hypothetical protein